MPLKRITGRCIVCKQKVEDGYMSFGKQVFCSMEDVNKYAKQRRGE